MPLGTTYESQTQNVTWQLHIQALRQPLNKNVYFIPMTKSSGGIN
jgi:hypothetical protein